jgi:hypothetical protein
MVSLLACRLFIILIPSAVQVLIHRPFIPSPEETPAANVSKILHTPSYLRFYFRPSQFSRRLQFALTLRGRAAMLWMCSQGGTVLLISRMRS